MKNSFKRKKRYIFEKQDIRNKSDKKEAWQSCKKNKKEYWKTCKKQWFDIDLKDSIKANLYWKIKT